MSREIGDVVRQPLSVGEHSRRRLEERLAVRFPRVLAFLARVVWSLPRRSWLRQAVIRRALRLTYEAFQRGDHEAQVVLFHPDGEVIPPAEFAALGFEPSYRGREQRAVMQRRWNAEWGEIRIESEEAIDLGDDRLLVVGRLVASGPSSEAVVSHQWAEIFTISGGLAIREEVFLDREEALKAAGLTV